MLSLIMQFLKRPRSFGMRSLIGPNVPNNYFGMRSLLGDGRIKILKGVTTPDEVAKYAQIEGFDPSEVSKK